MTESRSRSAGKEVKMQGNVADDVRVIAVQFPDGWYVLTRETLGSHRFSTSGLEVDFTIAKHFLDGFPIVPLEFYEMEEG